MHTEQNTALELAQLIFSAVKIHEASYDDNAAERAAEACRNAGTSAPNFELYYRTDWEEAAQQAAASAGEPDLTRPLQLMMLINPSEAHTWAASIIAKVAMEDAANKNTYTLYFGSSLPDVRAVRGPTEKIFEEIYSESMSPEYEECWNRWVGCTMQRERRDFSIICKTFDALAAFPAASLVAEGHAVNISRIGRSVRDSDKGAIITTALTHEQFMTLHRS